MIERELYMKRIRPFIGNELIKVLTGIRRSGKSVMLELIKQELIKQGIDEQQFISFNFEQMRNTPFCTAETLYKEITNRAKDQKGKIIFFFDEIQEVTHWEKCINSLRLDYDCDIYITGSNAKLLSGELATYLAGRYVEFVIYPFSFQEYLDMRKTSTTNLNISQEFQQYIRLGGMPFLQNLQGIEDASMQYLKDVYNSVVLKDIIQRNNIREVDMLERIITYVMANIGRVFSASSIVKYFKNENRKVSSETVMNYLKMCQEAFLIYKVSREDLAGKKILTVNEKYYIADHGIREAVYGNNGRDIELILENIVYMELIRRGYDVTIGKAGTKEIDFIAKKNHQKIYIQVTYLLASEQTIQREFGVYQSIQDNYPKYVVSMDEFDFSRDGIRHCNIRDFLLKKSYL